MSTQAEFISRYNDENRPRFNDRFFQKSAFMELKRIGIYFF